MTKNTDTLKGTSLVLKGPAVGKQHEDSGPWIHDTMIAHGGKTQISGLKSYR